MNKCRRYYSCLSAVSYNLWHWRYKIASTSSARIQAVYAHNACGLCGTPVKWMSYEFQIGHLKRNLHWNAYEDNALELMLTVDHIFPRAYGGSSNQCNLRLLCHTCHQAKTAFELQIGEMIDIKNVPMIARALLYIEIGRMLVKEYKPGFMHPRIDLSTPARHALVQLRSADELSVIRYNLDDPIKKERRYSNERC